MQDEEEISDDALMIYPNPSNDYFIVSGSELEDSQLIMYDMKGSLIMEMNLEENSTRIQTMDMLPGIYILRISSQDKVVSKKLIIK